MIVALLGSEDGFSWSRDDVVENKRRIGNASGGLARRQDATIWLILHNWDDSVMFGEVAEKKCIETLALHEARAHSILSQTFTDNSNVIYNTAGCTYLNRPANYLHWRCW